MEVIVIQLKFSIMVSTVGGGALDLKFDFKSVFYASINPPRIKFSDFFSRTFNFGRLALRCSSLYIRYQKVNMDTEKLSSTTTNPDMSNFHKLWEIKFKGSQGCQNHNIE